METLVLNGGLGERHKTFNETLKNVCSRDDVLQFFENMQPKNDVNRLLKVDIANNLQRSDFIIEVLKSEDSLLINRALKCRWFFQNTAFKDMRDLLSHVSFHTKCKLMHGLTVHLKNEKLAEEYFDYFHTEERNSYAVKFLPICTTAFIEKVFNEKYIELSETQLLKIGKRDLELVFLYFEKKERRESLGTHFGKVAVMLAMVQTERFLNWYERVLYPEQVIVKLGIRATSKIMQYARRRVVDNFKKYHLILKTEAVASLFDFNEMKEILPQILPEEESDFWSSKAVIVYTKKRTKPEQIALVTNAYEAVYKKTIPLDRFLSHSDLQIFLNEKTMQELALKNIIDKVPQNPHDLYVFKWYMFVDFTIAFPQLKDLVKSEPDAAARAAIIEVMIDSHCRTHREDDLLQLLRYVLKNHNKEQHRNTFILKLVNDTVPYKFSDAAWALIYELIRRYLFVEGWDSSGIQRAGLHEVIRRHLLKGTSVPEDVIESYIKNPTYLEHNVDKPTVEFLQLFCDTICRALVSKFEREVDEENDRKKEAVVDNMINFLWLFNMNKLKTTRSVVDYPAIIDYIRKERRFVTWMFDYYIKTDKKIYRVLIDVILSYNKKEKTILYCLKHRHDLFDKLDEETMKNVTASTWHLHTHFYKKIRIYFPDDLAKYWTEYYMEKLKDPESKEQLLKKTVFCLSTLLERDSYLNIVKPYRPSDAKIPWSEIDKVVLERQKLIASSSHYVQPHLPIDSILCYAKGDYLQYVLGSMVSLCYYYPPSKSGEVIQFLTNSAVSPQKHGIRFLLTLLDRPETIDFIMTLWQKSSNASIRFTIFKNLLILISTRSKLRTRDQHWESFKKTVSELAGESDDALYESLITFVEKINKTYFAEYCEHSWKALLKYDDRKYLSKFFTAITTRQSLLSTSFCDDLVINYIKDNLTAEENINFIVNYLNCVTDEAILMKRLLNIRYDYHRHSSFIKRIIKETFANYGYINPKVLLNYLSKDIPLIEEFSLVILIRLVCAYHEAFDALRSVKPEYDDISEIDLKSNILRSWQSFGLIIAGILCELTTNQFAQMTVLFQAVLQNFICSYVPLRLFAKHISESEAILNIAVGLIELNANEINAALSAIQILPKTESDLYTKIIADFKNDNRMEVQFFLNAHTSSV